MNNPETEHESFRHNDFEKIVRENNTYNEYDKFAEIGNAIQKPQHIFDFKGDIIHVKLERIFEIETKSWL